MAEGVIAEFSRPISLEEIGEGARRRIEADERERAALAERMKLPAIHELRADLRVAPGRDGGFLVRGNFFAVVEQECVRTLEPFVSQLEERVERLFVPADSVSARKPGSAPTVIELEANADDAPDIIEGEEIDLGELVAESLALALDPWPKKPGTEFMDYSTDGGGARTDEEGRGAATQGARNPFSVLQRLRGGGDEGGGNG